MGMVKKEFTEYEIGLESVEAGLEWMTRYGVKTFKDFTGEWIEVRCSRQPDFFEVDEVPIPHLVEFSS
tara:strand:- start:256 stop:459 length:204 start_codon:yes stop_codon:yes gene_type:complete